MNNQLLIYDLTFPDLAALLAKWNEPAYRARQIWQGLYQNFWNTPEKFTNIPAALRKKLFKSFSFEVIDPITSLQSADGETVKTAFMLHDGKVIESVLMKYGSSVAAQKENLYHPQQCRRTLCISTQVGCAMGCIFCATGQMGFKRHLSSGEIVAQVMYFANILHAHDEVVTNLVVMGMGEPFHNYDNTMSAIDRLCDPEGFSFGARRITISTVGIVPAIKRFTSEKRQVNLAISLHAADDALRASMLPVDKQYPIDQLLETCRDYVLATHRRITFEWALVNGVNDTEEQAHLLASKLKGMLCHVNAILLNPTEGYYGKATTHKRADKFKDILNKSGISCTIRLRRGIDIEAGCGQLIKKEL